MPEHKAMPAANPMRLYHYTAGEYLRGIAKHGLTVGAVSTDHTLDNCIVGVWLTSSESPLGHGFDVMNNHSKRQFRISADVPTSDGKLVKWSEWAKKNLSPLAAWHLKQIAASVDGVDASDTWFVYFGWIKPESIVGVTDTGTETEVPDWPTHWPDALSEKGVPYWRREAWLRKSIKHCWKTVRKLSDARVAA